MAKFMRICLLLLAMAASPSCQKDDEQRIRNLDKSIQAVENLCGLPEGSVRIILNELRDSSGRIAITAPCAIDGGKYEDEAGCFYREFNEKADLSNVSIYPRCPEVGNVSL